MSNAKMTWLLAAVLATAFRPEMGHAQDATWSTPHDAGWKAFQEGRLADAEKLLKSAAEGARRFGANDPRMATTLDHLAWVYCAQKKFSDAEPLARWALQSREKLLG